MEPFIEHLFRHRAELTQDWLLAVQTSLDFATPQSVTNAQLTEHIPSLYDDLLTYLRVGDEHPDAALHSGIHGSDLWTRHFPISDLLRGAFLLRGIVLRALDRFQADAPQPLPEPTARLTRVRLTEFFDAAVIVSVRQFAADQLTRTDDDYSRLSTRRKAAQSDADNLRAVDTTRLHLLRVTAHELRNLLNSASLTADALRDEADPLARAEMQATQTRSHQQMAMLLNQLLEAAPLLSGHETPKFAPLDLAAFARQESRTLERMAAAKGLRFDCEVPPDVGEVISDVAKLRRVVTNLAQNAIKYTESGCVAFAVARPEPSRWSIRISDTGPGIPPEHQSKIFEEFHRVPGTEGAEGTGLGLAIVKYLVLLLRGEIRVESQVGQGSSFYVQFPSEVA